MHHFSYLIVGLMVITFIHPGVMGNNAKGPTDCCFDYYTRRIPVRKVKSYRETRVDCPKPGVVFVTKKGLQICVDPQQSWVNSTMQWIDDRTF